MANGTGRSASRLTSSAFLSAVAIGAVTASVGIAPAAFAEEAYPSWEDVQKAKQNQATKKAEIEKISGLLSALRTAAAEATKEALIAAEAFHITQDALDAATAKETSLTRQAAAAKKSAETSKMRAGLIAAHLAKAGAQDISLNMFLNGSGADEFLHELGTASKLSEQSETIYRQAVQDKNTAESLTDQASSAKEVRTRLTKLSQAKFEGANEAARLSQVAFDTEQRKSTELFEQLALLKDTTAEAERQYQAGLDAAEPVRPVPSQPGRPTTPQPLPPAPAQPIPAPAPAPGQPPAPQPPVSQPAPPPPAPAPPAPAPAPAPQPAPPQPAPPAPAPPPNAGAVDTALGFARAQLGDRYVFGGSGPDEWDCSGLTKAAYAAAGVYIGSHSATNQYNTMRSAGRLVPFDQARAGDLVFWGSPGNYYHVALYVGGGRIIEAPNPSAPVREYYIWGRGDVAGFVGRPTG